MLYLPFLLFIYIYIYIILLINKYAHNDILKKLIFFKPKGILILSFLVEYNTIGIVMI